LAAPLYREQSEASFDAVLNVHHGLVGALAQNVNMPNPVSLELGDVVWITVANGRQDNQLTMNGGKVNGEVEPGGVLVLDDLYSGLLCRWFGPSYGWSI
jgi:uncharacterized protein YigE (DUF2233 family)